MKKLFIITVLAILALDIHAQESYDYGLFAGMSQKHLHTILPLPVPGTMGVAAGGYYRYNMNPRYALRGGVNAALDPVAGTPQFFEGYGLFEFNFHALNPRRESSKVSSYVGIGLSYGFDLGMYNLITSVTAPQAGFWWRNINIPFNLGIRYNALPNMTLGLEWALRKGYQLDFTKPTEPFFNFLQSNWRSHVGITVGYSIVKKCKTCPFYETDRTKRR